MLFGNHNLKNKCKVNEISEMIRYKLESVAFLFSIFVKRLFCFEKKVLCLRISRGESLVDWDKLIREAYHYHICPYS